MKNHSRVIGFGTLAALLLSMSLAGASAAKTLALTPSPEVPAAEGTAKLSKTKNGNIKINLVVKHLAPAERIVPGSSIFMVWVRGLGPDALPQNLGALQVDKKLNGKLTAMTALTSFDLFLTCEPSQTVTTPGVPELLSLHYANNNR